MNIQDTFEQLNRVYYTTKKVDDCKKAEEELDKILSYTWLDDENRTTASGLRIRIGIKRIALLYIEKNISLGGRDQLTEELKKFSQDASAKSYVKTYELAERVLKLTAALDEIYSKVTKARLQYRTVSGEYVPVSESSCTDAEKVYRECLISCPNLPSAESLFGKVVFLNPPAEIAELMQSLIEEAEDVRAKFIKTHFDDVVTKMTYIPPAEWDNFRYNPTISGESRGEAITVICTPFEKEFLFLAYAYAKKNGKNIVYINVEKLMDYSEADAKRLIKLFDSSSTVYAITGLSNYRFDNKAAIIKEFYELDHRNSDTLIFFHDHTGARHLWHEVETVLGNVPDISYFYLSVPDSSETIEILKQKGYVNSSEDENFVKNHCTYMGFIGLNKVVLAQENGQLWKEVGVDISRENAAYTESYFRELPSQSQLIDSGWGEHSPYSAEINGARKPFDFDYDAKRLCDPQNVKHITDLPGLTLAERCGLVVRYCLLLGSDVSDWKELEAEEREDRINVATKTVGRLLNVQFDPVVQVVNETKGSWGGYCSGGGRKIVYKNSCIGDYEWLAKAICHEMYHAFQSTASNTGWKIWHLSDLHVSRNRVEEWKYNNQRYVDIDNNKDSYMVQVVEADARIFEKETYEGAIAKWPMLSLK